MICKLVKIVDQWTHDSPWLTHRYEPLGLEMKPQWILKIGLKQRWHRSKTASRLQVSSIESCTIIVHVFWNGAPAAATRGLKSNNSIPKSKSSFSPKKLMLSSAFSHHHVALSLLPLCRCTAMRLPFPEHVHHYLIVLESSSQEGSIHAKV